MYTQEEIRDYRCPQWTDWPDLGLYMDQVIGLLERYVAGFYPKDQPRAVTSMMINNYVKQKIILPSNKKKYSREHMAHLYILFLLKPMLSLSEITEGFAHLTHGRGMEESYHYFCGQIETAIAQAFGGAEPGERCEGEEGEEGDVVPAISRAFAYAMLAKCRLEAGRLSRR